LRPTGLHGAALSRSTPIRAEPKAIETRGARRSRRLPTPQSEPNQRRLRLSGLGGGGLRRAPQSEPNQRRLRPAPAAGRQPRYHPNQSRTKGD